MAPNKRKRGSATSEGSDNDHRSVRMVPTAETKPTSLLDFTPKSRIFQLTDLWFRITDLQALKGELFWNTTSWLAYPMEWPRRYRMSLALDQNLEPSEGYGCYHFCQCGEFNIYFMFPQLVSDLVKNDALASHFHNSVLMPSYYMSWRGEDGPQIVHHWSTLKSSPETYRFVTIDVDASTHEHPIDLGKWWHLIERGVKNDPELEELQGLFLAVAYPGCDIEAIIGSTEEECWTKAMESCHRRIDISYMVQNTIHRAFTSVCPAPHLGSNPEIAYAYYEWDKKNRFYGAPNDRW